MRSQGGIVFRRFKKQNKHCHVTVSKGIVSIFFYFLDMHNVFCMGNLIANSFHLHTKRGEDRKPAGRTSMRYGMKVTQGSVSLVIERLLVRAPLLTLKCCTLY